MRESEFPIVHPETLPVQRIVSRSAYSRLFLLGHCPEHVNKLFARNPTWASTHQSFILCKGLVNPDPVRSNLILPQMLVMITTSHLQDAQRPTHRGLDLDPAKSHYRIYHET